MCSIFIWNRSNTMNVESALWILMAWCFSTRTSVATVLIMHPCISWCLRVKETIHPLQILTDQHVLIYIPILMSQWWTQYLINLDYEMQFQYHRFEIFHLQYSISTNVCTLNTHCVHEAWTQYYTLYLKYPVSAFPIMTKNNTMILIICDQVYITETPSKHKLFIFLNLMLLS